MANPTGELITGYQFSHDFHNKVGKHFALARLGPQVEKLSHAEAIRQRNERKAEADRLAAEELRDKADGGLIAALEERRVSKLKMAHKAAQVDAEAYEVGRQMIEDARERSRIEAQRLMTAANVATEAKKGTIDALLRGDERLALRVFKENVHLKEELRTTQKALAAAKQEIEVLTAKFSSAYNWLKDAVKKLEFFGDFSFSRIFSVQSVGDLRKGAKKRDRDKANPALTYLKCQNFLLKLQFLNKLSLLETQFGTFFLIAADFTLKWREVDSISLI